MRISYARAVLMGILFALSAHAYSADSLVEVQGPRPVADAIQLLISKYGYPISYEDPHYVFTGDVEDVTAKVRRDLDKYSPGQAPKVFSRRSAQLQLRLPEDQRLSEDAIASLLKEIVRSNATGDHDGRFKVLQVGAAFHVIPSEVKDSNGHWSVTGSILDAPISLPAQQRSRDQMLSAIVAAVASKSNVSIQYDSGFGGIISESGPALYALSASNEPARSVLIRALAMLGKPTLTWALYFDSSTAMVGNGYVMNLVPVP
jgi:hypothetical protein